MVHSRSVAANRYRACADSARRLPPAVAARKVSGMPLTWLITGCSRGLGRALAEAVAASGDRLVATARDPDTLADLFNRYPDRVLAVALDVTDRERWRPPSTPRWPATGGSTSSSTPRAT